MSYGDIKIKDVGLFLLCKTESTIKKGVAFYFESSPDLRSDSD